MFVWQFASVPAKLEHVTGRGFFHSFNDIIHQLNEWAHMPKIQQKINTLKYKAIV